MGLGEGKGRSSRVKYSYRKISSTNKFRWLPWSSYSLSPFAVTFIQGFLVCVFLNALVLPKSAYLLLSTKC